MDENAPPSLTLDERLARIACEQRRCRRLLLLITIVLGAYVFAPGWMLNFGMWSQSVIDRLVTWSPWNWGEIAAAVVSLGLFCWVMSLILDKAKTTGGAALSDESKRY